MEYTAEVEIEAEDLEAAHIEAIEMAGDGALLRDAELQDAYVEL